MLNVQQGLRGLLSNISCCGKNVSHTHDNMFSLLPMMKNRWANSKDIFHFYTGPLALHTLFHDSNDPHLIYGWGRTKENQLGEGNKLKQNISPNDPELICKVDSSVLSMSCGPFHSLISLKNGENISFGRNEYAEVGNKGSNISKASFFIKDTNNNLETFKQAVAGTEFSLGLSQNGNIYSWGRNSEGQLGRNDDFTEIPSKIQNLPPIQYISAGWGHCLAISGLLLLINC